MKIKYIEIMNILHNYEKTCFEKFGVNITLEIEYDTEDIIIDCLINWSSYGARDDEFTTRFIDALTYMNSKSIEIQEKYNGYEVIYQ